MIFSPEKERVASFSETLAAIEEHGEDNQSSRCRNALATPLAGVLRYDCVSARF